MTRATAVITAAIVGTVLAVGMFSAGMANAEDDKHWYFDVENESTDAVIELRTQEDGEWSENWLSNRIEPGDKTNATSRRTKANARCGRRSI